MKLNIRKTKVIALFLTLILLVTSMPISAYAENSTGILTSYSPADQATKGCGIEPKADVEATTVLAEIVSRREENVKHFDIGNGLYQAVTYGTAVHRKDSNGVWQDIDNRLVLNAQDNMYSTSDGRTRLSATTNSSGSLISLSEDGYTLSMSPISNTLNTTTMAEITNHEELDFSSVEGKSIEEASAVRNTSSVRYQNVFASADIEYILTSNDVKENIIVKSPQISYTYSFALSVQSLTAELQETGEIVFHDIHTNEIKYHIPAPYMYDSLGSVSHDVEYSLETVSNGYVITITADSSWLNNAERAFPVTIDPTIQKAIVFDTFISSANPTENYGSSSELWISPSRISFLRCSMPTIPSGCQFYAANLYVYYYYYSYITDGELYAGVYQVMHSWSENELTWNIAQPSSTTYISSTRLSTGYMSGARGAYSGSPKTASFDVTTAAASWYANPSSNFGIALKYQSGTNSSVILKSYEAGSEYRAYFVITYTEPQIVNGVYRIKNAQNGMYLDTTGGGVTAGTKIQQWSRASSDTNRNQLFKITFVRTIGSTEQLNYYTIRPMTNNRMGLDSLLGGTAQDVTIEKMSTSDNWDYILYNNLWIISKSGSYYTVKNGRISDMSYMTAPSNTINGAKIFTNDSITDYSKWVLEPYTGEELKGVGWISFASTLIVGEQFSYEAYMYDNRIGINGPISYSVTNTDNSTTDKATIDAMGRIRALKPGTIKIKITYPSSTLIWWWIVTIEESMEGLHLIKNRHYDRYAQVDDNDAPGYANNGGIMEIWPFNGENHQKWIFTHVGSGYYKITSAVSGYAITVPSGEETNDNVDLILTTYSGNDRQKWKITLTSHGSYKIKAKSSEGYTSQDLVMDMETNIWYDDGLNIRQREYLDNTSYKDEWILQKIKDKAIIIVPGITCSSLQNENGTKVWLFVGQQSQIACDENGNSVNSIYPYNPDNYGVLDMYKNVFETLTSNYSNEYDVIFFAYDWRMTCADAAEKLEALTDYYDSCVIVAHSMGGIVASRYLSRSQANRNKVDKFISLGTPYTGAPKALYVMETGKLMWITEAALNLSEYAKNIPALYELFPNRQYFQRYSRFIEVDGASKNGYTDSWDYMKTLHWAKKNNGVVKPMFNAAETFHNSLYINGTHVAERNDVDTYKIIGVGEDTITTVAFDANDKYDFYYYTSEGDGTVPTYSALNNVDKYSYKTYAFYKNHTDLIEYDGCINLIIDIINEVPYVYYDPNTTVASASAISYNSEVIRYEDVQIVDNRITIVAKDILNLDIYTESGCIVYSEGDQLFYNDIYGTKHRVGTVWSLGENSKQYVLFNGQYRIDNIDIASENSSIRLDYCNYGLSENCVRYENINNKTKIQIKRWVSGMYAKDEINTECT